MGFKIGDTQWVKTQANIAGSILLAHMEKGVIYNTQSLKELLRLHKCYYTNPELAAVGRELIDRGILEETD